MLVRPFFHSAYVFFSFPKQYEHTQADTHTSISEERNSDYQTAHMQSPPILTENSKVSLLELRRLNQTISPRRIERCYFLLLHSIFFLIILLLVFLRLGRFEKQQAKFFLALTFNQSRALIHHNNHIECACQPIPFPKRNQSTRCLELHVGLTDIISNVFCPVNHNDRNHHQWLIVQNRQSASVSFNRTWLEYRRGFGRILDQVDYWIGNENLYWLTNNYQCRLKILLTDWHNETREAIYDIFRIGSQKDDYRIQIDDYDGDMEGFNRIDSFSRWHYNAPFSTHDHYPKESANCPSSHGGGGWWFHSGAECAHVHLNGRLATHSDGLVPHNTGVLWTGWKVDRHYSFKRVSMAIQPKLKGDRHRYRRTVL